MKGLPPQRANEHKIQLVSDAPLSNLGLYYNLVIENKEIKKQVMKLLNQDMIKPSSSPCRSPVVLEPKKDGVDGGCALIIMP